jgi:glycerate kinase
MRIVIAPDKFKGCLPATAVALAMARGVQAACGARLDVLPMADGGEGTVEALVNATGGTLREASVTGPLGEKVRATYGELGDGRTAVIEMAAASGLVLVAQDRRNPLWTTTRGTGELLLHAIDEGAGEIILGIGGSATNDGGAGLAQSLGFRLLDDNGRDLPPGGGALGYLDRIDPSTRDRRLDGVRVRVACDVDNPLCGPRGASAVFGPQKGATSEMVQILDRDLDHFAKVIERDLGVSVGDLPGAGAAGGLGAGLVAFASGTLGPGVDLIIDVVGLEGRLRGAALCLTGEGALDASSAGGKTAVGVARLARRLGVPTLAIVGSIGPGAEAVLDQGIDGYFSICPGPMTLDEAIADASHLMEKAAEQVTRAFLAGRGSHAPSTSSPG